MGIFDRLRGHRPEAPKPAPAGGAATIRVFDNYGREMHITREAWRTQVLPPNLAAARAPGPLIAQAVRELFP